MSIQSRIYICRSFSARETIQQGKRRYARQRPSMKRAQTAIIQLASLATNTDNKVNAIYRAALGSIPHAKKVVH